MACTECFVLLSKQDSLNQFLADHFCFLSIAKIKKTQQVIA